MNGHVLVTFLETVVLAVVVQVIPPDDDCPLHLQFLNHSTEDTSANVNGSSEWAFLVDVVSFGSLRKQIIEQK